MQCKTEDPATERRPSALSKRQSDCYACETSLQRPSRVEPDGHTQEQSSHGKTSEWVQARSKSDSSCAVTLREAERLFCVRNVPAAAITDVRAGPGQKQIGLELRRHSSEGRATVLRAKRPCSDQAESRLTATRKSNPAPERRPRGFRPEANRT